MAAQAEYNVTIDNLEEFNESVIKIVESNNARIVSNQELMKSNRRFFVWISIAAVFAMASAIINLVNLLTR